MDWNKHETFFSSQRLNRYLIACNQNIDKAMELYKYNIQVSQAIYPLVSILEVSLRNKIDHALANFFNDRNWLLTQRPMFADNITMTYKDNYGVHRQDFFFLEKLEKAERWLNSRKKSINHGRLLAELSFAFWVRFFEPNPIRLLKGAPLKAFVNKPNKKLSLIHAQLRSILLLRNRIAHNEPICFNNAGNICPVTLRSYELLILEILFWLDADLKVYSEKMNYCRALFNRISTLVQLLQDPNIAA